MAEIKYGTTHLVISDNTGWNVTWEYEIPDSFPSVLAFAGAHVIFPMNEIPLNWRNAYLYSTYTNLTRQMVISYLASGENISSVVITTAFGSTPNAARIVPLQLQNTQIRLASIHPDIYASPWDVELDGWWVGNAFSFITYKIMRPEETIFPVVWLGALFINGNTEAKQDNTYLYLCAIPLDENKTPIQFLFKLPGYIFTSTYSWRMVPICVTKRGLLIGAASVEDFYPPNRVFTTGTPNPNNPFASVEIGLNDLEQTVGHVTFFDLPSDALPLYACPEHLFSGFDHPLNPTILSPYEGLYWTYHYDTNSFATTSINLQPIADVPLPSTFSCDGKILLGADYYHTYFWVNPPLGRWFLIPRLHSFFLVKNENSEMLVKRGFLPFSEIEDLSGLNNLSNELKLLIPSISVEVMNGRAIIPHFKNLYHVDIDSNAILKILEVKEMSGGVGLPILSPCGAYLPQNCVQATPIITSFYPTTTGDKPISALRVSRPIFLPETTTAIVVGYIRNPQATRESEGKIIVLERSKEQIIELKDLVISYTPTGGMIVKFEAPVSTRPVAFVVENPPYPYLRAGPPDPKFVIIDSMANPHNFEKDISGIGSGTWLPMGKFVTRRSKNEPPYNIRVYVIPENSQYIRIVAYYPTGGIS